VVGISAIAAGSLAIRKRLIDLDASLFAGTAVIFFFFARDGRINFLEGLALVIVYLVYICYASKSAAKTGLASDKLISPDLISAEGKMHLVNVLPSRIDRSRPYTASGANFDIKSFLLLILGVIGLVAGAYMTIEALINIADQLLIPASLAAMTILAIGVVLPEIFIALRAVSKKTCDLALGNIYGSTITNLLLVVWPWRDGNAAYT